MKYLILIATLVSTPLFAKAVIANPANEGPNLDKKSVYAHPIVDPQIDSLGGIRKLASIEEEEEKDEYSELGKGLCLAYTASAKSSIVEEMRNTIVDTMGKVDPPNPNPTDREIIEFLNKHSEKLTCWGKHYLAVAFDDGVYMEVYTEFFKVDSDDADAYKVNFDAVTMTYNPSNPDPKNLEPMTILDYIQKVALRDIAISGSTTGTQNVKYIRSMIRGPKHAAKFFAELPEPEKRAFAR